MLGNLCDARCVFQVSTDAAGRAVIRGRRASHAAMHGRSRRHFQLSDSPITHVDHSDYFSFSTVFRDLLDRISLKLTKKKKGSLCLLGHSRQRRFCEHKNRFIMAFFIIFGVVCIRRSGLRSVNKGFNVLIPLSLSFVFARADTA